jgi:outer membrane protein assembly factor BamB
MKLPLTYPALLGTAIVAGVFSGIVALLLVVDFMGRGSYELFDTPQYVQLKAQLQENPGDEQLETAIRRLDLELRTRYFEHRLFMRRGIYLLIGGLVLCLVTARAAAAQRPRVPQPGEASEKVDRLQAEQRYGRRGALGLVAAVVLLMCALALQADRTLPESLAQLPAGASEQETGADGDAAAASQQGTGESAAEKAQQTQAPPVPDYETYLSQWPRFRGPTGSGATELEDIPQSWDVESGEGVLWKEQVPLPGPNSPIIWQNRLFLSGATAQEQAVFCYDADTGKLLWRVDAPPILGDVEEFEVAEYTGYAAPTMATDGVRAYAIFATGNLVATDFEGQQLWRKNLGPPKNPYGHASSLATYRDLVIVQFDQGTAEDDPSRLIALHGATGEVAWEVARQVPTSWASPIVVEHDQQMMVVTCANPWVIAYAAEDGKELWRADCLGGEIGPSPVFRDGVVYAANEASGLFAIGAGGEGDVTDSHILWFADFDIPDVSSPLATEEFVITQSHGYLACFGQGKAEDVDQPRDFLWEEDMGAAISSSPSQAGELIYVISEEGTVFILKPTADSCERVAELEIGEPCRSSPAFRPGRMYLRGKEHLFCFGK